MRSSLLLPPHGLFSRDSVQLGRLVRNATNPHQDYHYPFGDSSSDAEHPSVVVKTQQNFQELITSSRCASLRTRLKLSAIGAITTNATEARTYQLDNSGAWFKKACGEKATREWILDAIKDGAKMYLTVGYHVVVDALVYERRGEFADKDGQARGDGGGDGNSEVQGGLDSGNVHERKFGAPGEHIYAVQYRKLRFKWFSSHDVDQVALERNNRWKVSLGVRGEDDGEEDDVLEADLADGMDVKGGERYVSEDGMDEFVFDWDEDEDDDDDEDKD
ncbi:hypothetical protein BZA05DRAFT_396681 [Tricharina praecox]|uniref:uncharacterized protein n=1 Tax=Tricharina praecox TaxID=43433 RepID=UPI00221F1038|nr:uncharacterized protein BZA05DRAFT_396681 [Tricharina praecox]KAI5853624.1 hypothetical protein BZA05DRAFT_396681 [Tricharina praecox]